MRLVMHPVFHNSIIRGAVFISIHELDSNIKRADMFTITCEICESNFARSSAELDFLNRESRDSPCKYSRGSTGTSKTLRVNYSAMPVTHGLANILRSKRWIFTKLSEVIFLIIL